MSHDALAEVAAELVRGRDRSSRGGATLLLGAGASVESGVPMWPAMALEVVKNLQLRRGRGAVAALERAFADQSVDHPRRAEAFAEVALRGRPSRGYMHLAQLVNEGFISTVLTTNWDPLVEESLAKLMAPRDVKVLVRGEVDDDRIAKWLDSPVDSCKVTVVKLHGDAASGIFFFRRHETREFSAKLRHELSRLLQRPCVMVGQSARDVDTLSVLLEQDPGRLFYTRVKQAGAKTPNEIDQLLQDAGAVCISGEARRRLAAADPKIPEIGAFDDFFTELNLAVQDQVTAARLVALKEAQKSILTDQGLGFLNHRDVAHDIEVFTKTVQRLKPDVVLFVHDPDAPGGTELSRRMRTVLERAGAKVDTVTVKGQKRSRTYHRHVQPKPPAAISEVDTAGKTVVVLDAISFSGNTLHLVRDQLAKDGWAPHAVVKMGALVVSKHLLDTGNGEILNQRSTNRFEIVFPWGITQVTSEFDRQFAGGSEDAERTVQVRRRAWGAIEIFADYEMSSVRLLTIEARDRLSFQRHLCRDEFFVALDDNIGLDICADPLPPDALEYDARIESVVLEKGDYVLIPRGIWHRTKASMDRVRLLEVAFGIYDQNHDLERRWDDRGRARRGGRE